MSQIVFFLEEPSAKEMLNGVLPKILPETMTAKYVVFQGKQDLEKRLPIRLKAWQDPNTKFVVMRDQDSGNCVEIKNGLLTKCRDAGKPETLVRIACHELEAFYLGDLQAVGNALGPTNLGRQQDKAKFRNPDTLNNAAQELKKLVPSYQKVSGSRALSPHLDIDNNCSTSFTALIAGVRRLIEDVA